MLHGLLASDIAADIAASGRVWAYSTIVGTACKYVFRVFFKIFLRAGGGGNQGPRARGGGRPSRSLHYNIYNIYMTRRARRKKFGEIRPKRPEIAADGVVSPEFARDFAP
jgi:hypothetical protein